jgi:hypothetical protein
MRAIVKEALAIPEMQFGFECICADDKKEPEDYTDQEIVEEAEYRLFTYFEDGHMNSDEMRMGDDPEMNKVAQKDIRMLKKFIKKHRTTESYWSRFINHLIK